MKKLCTILFSMFFLFSAFSQSLKTIEVDVKFYSVNPKTQLTSLSDKPSKFDINRSPQYNAISNIRGNLTSSNYVNLNNPAASIKTYFKENVSLFGLVDPERELEEKSKIIDEYGKTHIKFLQKIDGITITKSEIVAHVNSLGVIEGINGNYVPTPTFNKTASIGKNEAESKSIGKFSIHQPEVIGSTLHLLEHNLKYYLAYEVKLTSKHFPNLTVYVSASDGSIIKYDDGIRYDGPANGTGIGLNGQTRQLKTYLSAGDYALVNTTLPMFIAPVDSLKGVIDIYDAKNDTTANGYMQASLILDPNKDNVFDDNTRLRAAVDAAFYTEIVYDFFKKYFNRNSFDDKGATISSVVHYKKDFNNAFWNGYFMTFGDGDNYYFSNLAGGFDVIVHELGHAVTQYTADLVYENQSGALNESFSDIFASIADSTNWLIGEDIFTPGTNGDALRNMADPHNGTLEGGFGWQPAHMDEFQFLPNTEEGDNGGVHINSGIPNKAFYNLATNIGRYKAGIIFYRALKVYLTRYATFLDTRIACINSAKDIFGESSNEVTMVIDAFNSVGITSETIQTQELAYDDGSPDQSVYETEGDFILASKFNVPSNDYEITKCRIYIVGDFNSGNGSFSLILKEADNNGIPNTDLITPYYHQYPSLGWNAFDLTNVSAKNDFFVGIKYDAINRPLVGADYPGINNAYEFDPRANQWFTLIGQSNYNLFIRATIKFATGVVELDSKIPDNFYIDQNFPNPFNPSTTLKYGLSKQENINISIYDIKGSKVAELLNGDQSAGNYQLTWNGKDNNGNEVSSGVYFCQFITSSTNRTIKMLLQK